jgi:hypothetical protein
MNIKIFVLGSLTGVRELLYTVLIFNVDVYYYCSILHIVNAMKRNE